MGITGASFESPLVRPPHLSDPSPFFVALTCPFFFFFKIGQPLLPLLRAKLRKDSQPVDGCRGLKRLRTSRVVLQPVVSEKTIS